MVVIGKIEGLNKMSNNTVVELTFVSLELYFRRVRAVKIRFLGERQHNNDKKQVSVVRQSDFCSIAQGLLGQGLNVRFRVTGSSMKPFFRGGEIVTVCPVDVNLVKVGDIILVKTDSGALYLHRYIKMVSHEGEIKYVSRGDAHITSDGLFFPRNIMGKVVAIQRLTGRRGGNVDLTGALGRISAYARVGICSLRSFVVCSWLSWSRS